MREIGSNFWENKNKNNLDINFLNKEFINYEINYFKSGRNAIKAISRYLKKNETNVILLPMYTCSTVVDPFIEEGWKVFYFDINNDLSPCIDDLEKKINEIEPNLILFHSYFGFDTYHTAYNLLKKAQSKGITIIEDITQSLFSTFERFSADYYIASLRKFFCISDGGVLISREQIDISYESAEDELVILNEKASKLKKDYMNYIIDQKEEFRFCYETMNNILSNNNEIKKISQNALFTLKKIDDSFIRNKRKENYRYLKDNLENNQINFEIIFSNMSKEEVPLYFPIYLKNNETRKIVQKYMAENNIYCPIIWPKPQTIHCFSYNSEKIYDCILCIPIDQRYSYKEMSYISDILIKEVSYL